MSALKGEERVQNKAKRATVRSAKECAHLAAFVAVVIAVQLVLSAVPGVELVTVLFVSYAFTFGWKRGMAAATAFSLLRQLLFGFFPVVLILYFVYYNLLTLLFGLLGKRLRATWRGIWLIIALACVSTIVFTCIDNVLTPLWYGYTKKAAQIYFYASFYFLLPHTICVGVSVGVLFIPLQKTFSLLKTSVLRLK